MVVQDASQELCFCSRLAAFPLRLVSPPLDVLGSGIAGVNLRNLAGLWSQRTAGHLRALCSCRLLVCKATGLCEPEGQERLLGSFGHPDPKADAVVCSRARVTAVPSA